MQKIFLFIKKIIEIMFNLNLFFYHNTHKPKIVLLLTPQYLNFGDHGIAVEERKLLKRLCPDKKILEINYTFYQFWPNIVKNIINDEDTIVITGGGYMGDLCLQLQLSVNEIFKTYSKYKIILAPQTIYFKEEQSEALKQFKRLLTHHGNVYVFAREENTIHLLTEIFGLNYGTQCALMPDLVLFLNASHLYSKKRKNNIGLCIRNDHERTITDETLAEIKKQLAAGPQKICKIKMAYNHVEIPIWISNLFVRKKLKQYANKDLIITDRLHGMIFAAITGTPCIVFDNVSKKISGVYRWIQTLDYIKLVNNLSEFDIALQNVTNIDHNTCQKQIVKLQKQLEQDYYEKAKLLL